MAELGELKDILTDNQIDLLSRTLQIKKGSNKSDQSKDSRRKGLCPELKMRSAFVASFTSANAAEQALNVLGQEHFVFTGIGIPCDTDNFILEEGVVNLRSASVRRAVWDRMATKIQSSWRGMKCRADLLSK